MNLLRKFLLFAALTLCALSAGADYRVRYFVGYGLYPPVGPFGSNTASTTPGTGLLAVNGSHRALIQLISAGPNGTNDGYGLGLLGFYVEGDDRVLDSRILEAGVDGVDEWGYTATLPPPFVSTNSASELLFVRVHKDATPLQALDVEHHWTYDSPLFQPEDSGGLGSLPHYQPLETVIHVETGAETVPAAGIALDQRGLFCLFCPDWTPDPPDPLLIQYVEFNPETAGMSYPIPFSYSFNAVYGADAVLPGGGWNWQLLSEGADYTVTNGVVTLVTTGASLPKFRVVRLGLIHNF
jgi:hypothetical protein